MQNEPEVYAKTHKILDCKDYLQFRMTGVFATDYTLASATTYFNPWAVKWWEDILKAMELPMDKLPIAMAATDKVGELTDQAAKELGLEVVSSNITFISKRSDLSSCAYGIQRAVHINSFPCTVSPYQNRSGGSDSKRSAGLN